VLWSLESACTYTLLCNTATSTTVLLLLLLLLPQLLVYTAAVPSASL
jgi:hypothetical protein